MSNHGWSDGIDIFGRYLAIFHGGSIERWSGQRWDDPTYVAYVTETMVRDAWGRTDRPVPPAELDEWEAYCEGEVYFYDIERKVKRNTTTTTLDGKYLDESSHEEWESVDSCGGYYGEKWAREAALEALDTYAPKVVAA